MIILKKNTDNLFFKYIESKPIKKIFKDNVDERGFWFRLFRKFELPFLVGYLGSWKKEIPKLDTILFFDDGFNCRFSKYIKKKNPSAKIILWFWNAVDDSNKKFLTDKNIDEFWTYDFSDVKKYGMNYNTQFYSKNVTLLKFQIKNDVVFLGRDKGRKQELLSLKSLFEKEDLRVDFRIIESEEQSLGYDDYLKIIAESKCILDYNWAAASGCTLRVMESIFFEKKLITNNSDIASYDFYRPENIFILGKDDMSKIKEFINSPYKKIDRKIVDYYDFENWLKRFKKEKK